MLTVMSMARKTDRKITLFKEKRVQNNEKSMTISLVMKCLSLFVLKRTSGQLEQATTFYIVEIL